MENNLNLNQGNIEEEIKKDTEVKLESNLEKSQTDKGNIDESKVELIKEDEEQNITSSGDFVKIDFDYVKKVSFSMVTSHINLIKSIILTNLGSEDLSNLTLKIDTTPNIIEELVIQIPNLPKGKDIDLGLILSVPLKEFILSLSERSKGNINLRLFNNKIEFKKSFDLEILALKEWPGATEAPEITASFSLPLDQTVNELKMRAKQIYKTFTNLDDEGYVNHDKNLTIKKVAAIYRTLEEKSIKFMIPPQNYMEVGQRIRFPKEIIDEKVATALDITMLFASILESFNLNPLVLLNEKHSYIGVFLDDESFFETVTYDISSISKRAAQGIDKIIVLDPVTIMDGVDDDFDKSVENANNILSIDNNFLCAIDIKRARSLKIMPITKSDDNSDKVDTTLSEEDILKLIPKEIKTINFKEEVSDVKASRNKLWERKLLDLSFRNNLINFRLTGSTIPVVTHNVDELINDLENGTEINVLSRPSDWDNLLSDFDKNNGRELTMFKGLAKDEFTNHRLRSLISKEELEKRGNKIKRESKVSLEENGANTLYLVLGMLKYSVRDKKDIYAPIILAPIEITSRILGSGFTIKLREEDLIINDTLLEFLKQEKGIIIDGLSEIPMIDEHVDLRRVFSIFRDAILNEEGWDIREEATFGLFSFTKYLMWNDLKNNFDEFKKNKVVESLVEGKLTYDAKSIDYNFRFDEDYLRDKKLIFPVSSDSSQTRAVIASYEGESFVLHGPPGTGKSQTITNIIANALLNGKRVLFVAQKMAALEVVQRRLDAIGIGSFCLELHSNKAKKKNVLAQLENSLKITKIKKMEDFNLKNQDIVARKDELNDIVKALYDEDESGFSIYDLLINFQKLKDFDKVIEIEDGFEFKNLKEKERLLENVTNLGAFSGGPYMHPLKGINKTEYFPTMKGDISNILNSLDLEKLSDALKLVSNNGNKFDTIAKVIDYKNFIEKHIELVNQEGTIFGIKDSHNSYVDIKLIADLLDEYNEKKSLVLKDFKDGILDINPNELIKTFKENEDKFFALKFISKNPAIKILNEYSIKNTYSKDDAPKVFQSLTEVYDLRNDILQKIKLLNGTVSTLDKDLLKTDTTYLREVSTKLEDYYKNYGDSSFSIYHDNLEMENFNERAKDFIKIYNENEKQLIQLEDLLKFNADFDLENNSNNDNVFTTLSNKKAEVLENIDGLKDYIQYINAKNKANENGLKLFTKYYDDGKAREDEVISIFRKSLYRDALIKRLKTESKLVNITSKSLDEKINELEKIVSEYQLIEKQELYNTLSQNIPSLLKDIKVTSELATLHKAIRSGGKNLSLRNLLKETDNTLRMLTPCMLMSPLSVSQYLEAKNDLFDLVVFDEASQMQTPEAIGAIGRGKQIIVVGDPKQLPPTSFFMTQTKDDEEEIDEDLDNVLEDALALNLPQRYLLWHYRSRHESLISFSNRNFYDNKLYTYPSSNDLVSKVNYIKNDGIYDRSGTRTNEVEAQAIVDEVVRRLKDKELSKYSMGIVTFSKVQQTLIEDLLQKKLNEDETLEEKINSLSEELFVKNLENVQGDERDVILFSIGYGLDKDGVISMNFGPINQESGWKRLNVAVSRARYEMLVFTNINPDLFNVPSTSSRGVIALKDFIKFAKDGRKKQTLDEVNKDLEKEGLNVLVADRLREEGYKIETTIGSSEFKIDLGIINPDNEDEFILGIMCGGPSYRDATSAYDRDILQKSVLEGLNWNIYNVYPMDYLDNEDKEIKNIINLVEELRRNKKAQINKNEILKSKENLSDEELLKEGNLGDTLDIKEGDTSLNEEGTSKYKEMPYVKNNLSEKEMAMDELLKVSNANDILKDLEEIIKIEAPISNKLLTKRIKERYKLNRITSKTEKHIEQIVNKNKPSTMVENDNIIYFGDINKESYLAFRKTLVEDEDRLLTDISILEIENAICFELFEEATSERNIIRKVSTLLGYPRLNMENELHIKNILNKMTLEGKLIKTDTGLIGLP